MPSDLVLVIIWLITLVGAWALGWLAGEHRAIVRQTERTWGDECPTRSSVSSRVGPHGKCCECPWPEGGGE